MEFYVDDSSLRTVKTVLAALKTQNLSIKSHKKSDLPSNLRFLATEFALKFNGWWFMDHVALLVHLYKDKTTEFQFYTLVKWLTWIEDGSLDTQRVSVLESKFSEWSVLEAVSLTVLFKVEMDLKINNQLLESMNCPLLRHWYQSQSLSKSNCKPVTCSADEQSTTQVTDTEETTVKAGISITLNHHKRKVMPKNGERNVLITSALPYVNNVPHLGNIIGCVLSADVFARTREYNTLYVCGTDEYGTATETKALEEKISCQALCDKYHKVHKDCYEWFGIDFDYFGRTTTPAQTQIAQDIFKKCDANGFLTQDTITQLYCPVHKSFLADRYVEGTCPHCTYPDARGDQCDGCGKLLNAVELIQPRCKLDNAAPILRDSKHMFLDLSKLQSSCSEWVDKSSVNGKWTPNGIHITNSWLKEGLRPRCITRDLKWGTPVPKEGFEDKVFYVWFDAPIGYLSITANYTKDWEKWWKNPEQVELFQFMGKDNVPFHTVIFPCSLMGTKENWSLLNHVNTTEYLQYEGQKFSKSRGIGVFGNNVVESKVPVEVWRYYLFSVRPETNDSQFTWKGLIAANNNELLANLGNFVNRIVKFVNVKYSSVIPKTVSCTLSEQDSKLVVQVNEILKAYTESMELSKIRQALKLVMDISACGNVYLQESGLDNKLFEAKRIQCDHVVTMALNLCYLISALVYPFMPTTSDSIQRQLRAPMRTLKDIEKSTWIGDELGQGHRISKAEYLFKRIDPEMEEKWRAKYGGQTLMEDPAPPAKKSSKHKKTVDPTTLVTDDPHIQQLQIKVKEQGEVVRKLKNQVEPNAQNISDAVALLLNLKKELTDALNL